MATVVVEKDAGSGIARVTLNNPDRKNAYDPAMRRLLDEAFDDIANDDSMKVLLLRGAGGVFCTGADMANAYSWYDGESDGEGDGGRKRRPSQRRRLAVDRNTFSFYHRYLGYPKATVAQVEGYALGGGLELALMSDISVVASDTKIGMPAARFLGPALGTLH